MMEANWKITKLYVWPWAFNIANCVNAADWECYASSDGFSSKQVGTCNMQGFANQLVPYETLTENQVLNWIWECGVDKDAVEQQVLTDLNNQINPPVISPPLPWA